MPESLPDKDSGAEPIEKVDQAPNTEVTDVKPSAESSPAERDGTGSLLDAVKAALKPEPSEKSPDSKTEGSEADKADKPDAAKAKGKEAEPGELSEEDLSRLNRKTQERIKHLLAARKESEAKLADLEPKANQFDQVVRFVQEAGLSTQEVNDGFEVMRLLKRDLPGAYKRLKPIVEQLEVVLGVQIPDDLQQAVNEGQITEAHARELSRTRSEARLSAHQVQERDRAASESKRREAFEANQTSVQNAVAEWEKSKAGSDLEWQHKQARVMEIVRLETLSREKADPQFAWTPDEAIKFAEAALDRVNTEFKRFMPKPKAMNPITDVAATRSEAKPKTALEAAKQGLARMAG